MTERELRRKLTFRAHGSTLVLIKRPEESTEHVLQKALLWALYLPSYPTLRVEVPLPTASRYKPDLLALDEQHPLFWGECGVVSAAKLADLLHRYRGTHFVFSKWTASTSTCRFVHLESGFLKSWPHLDGENRLNPLLCSHFPQEQAFLWEVLLQNRPPGDAAARIGAHFLPPVGRIFRTDSGNERTGSVVAKCASGTS